MDSDFLLPWTRLHATKDYFDMIAILDNYPKIKLNVNLVPSLMVQLDEYAKGFAKDKFLDSITDDIQNVDISNDSNNGNKFVMHYEQFFF